ncbi:MAG: hypothetical protein BWY84_00042 [Candidatus Aerophobetes bacterium ADurb.Bin490]|nr:MAG: hypothetical protein BWY84_00042 [Candidatus Aerophobetes bacterium ADurb.Bin490]
MIIKTAYETPSTSSSFRSVKLCGSGKAVLTAAGAIKRMTNAKSETECDKNNFLNLSPDTYDESAENMPKKKYARNGRA